MKACNLCNGTRMDQRLDAHTLCVVRQRKGIVIPQGDQACVPCNGEGRIVTGQNWPTFQALDACTKTCETCKGSGVAHA